MQRKTKKIVLALVVIGAVAAGGAAFTASNTVPDSVAGYGTSTVTGATADSVHYTLIGHRHAHRHDVRADFGDPITGQGRLAGQSLCRTAPCTD